MTHVGIYKICNLHNGNLYIGSTINFEYRKEHHFALLNNNYHDNKHLQRAWNKYGKEVFSFEIIEFVDDVNILAEREQYWINEYAVRYKHKLYNLILNVVRNPIQLSKWIDKDQLLAYKKRNLSNKQIAKLTGICADYISRIVRFYGLQDYQSHKNKKYSITKEELEFLIEQGFSQSAIAKFYNCSRWVIQDRMQHFEIVTAIKEDISDNDFKALLKTKSVKEVAEVLNCSWNTVYRRMERLKIHRLKKDSS